jgi:putative transcriptional regulator
MEKKSVLVTKLGAHIRKIREKKGISQSGLAKLVDKERQSIQRLEAGNMNPTFYYLCEIADGLKVDVEELLNF